MELDETINLKFFDALFTLIIDKVYSNEDDEIIIRLISDMNTCVIKNNIYKFMHIKKIIC
jgi:hypothetical protein